MSFVSGAVEETDAGCFGALADGARVRAYERALWGALCHVSRQRRLRMVRVVDAAGARRRRRPVGGKGRRRSLISSQ